MFTGSLTEEVKALEEDIEGVKAKVDDPVMCEKIRQFVYAPREIQDMFKADAGQSPHCPGKVVPSSRSRDQRRNASTCSLSCCAPATSPS